MMHKSIILLFAALCLSAQAMSMGSNARNMSRFMPSPLGDARCGAQSSFVYTDLGFPGLLDFELPTGEWEAMTVCYWSRITTTNTFLSHINRIPFCSYCPEPLRRSLPDLLANAGGCANAAGTNISGTVTVSYAFPAETGTPCSNSWPRGVYTVSGWASNAVTLNLGGNAITIPTGVTQRAYYPGAANDITLSGTGLVSLGVCRCWPHEFFGRIYNSTNNSDNVLVVSENLDNTNEIAFTAWRISLSGAEHSRLLYFRHLAGSIALQITDAESFPAHTTSLSSRGMYRFGWGGLGSPEDCDFYIDFFDARVFPRLLSDSELDQIYRNGAEEIARRGIPQWR